MGWFIRRPIIGTKDGITKKWDSVEDCAKDLGVKPCTVSNVLRWRGRTVRGFTVNYQRKSDGHGYTCRNSDPADSSID